ncbi:MAG TPA: LPP20 family lipoprotein [Sulfuricella sp.]|nr:LPP20 family lipoprotein [Sulfuricella sp.]
MKKLALVVLMGSLFLAGCAINQPEKPATQAVAVEAKPQPTIRLTAVGYGASSSFDGYTQGQRRLMAMRASKLDAYRALAEQIYGVRVVGNSTVSALATQNDGFRVYVNAFVRGSRVISVTPMADGNYETELEIDVSQNFYDYFRSGTEVPAGNSAPPAVARGSVGPGSSYGTNFYYSE